MGNKRGATPVQSVLLVVMSLIVVGFAVTAVLVHDVVPRLVFAGVAALTLIGVGVVIGLIWQRHEELDG